VKKEVVAGAPLHPRGYKILMEVLGKGRWEKAREIPFVFRDRRAGSSKLRPGTILDYMRQVLDISRHALSCRQGPVWEECRKILSFGIVGLSGIVVNMGVLWLLTSYFGIYYLLSAILAIEVSILNNFLWNDLWTFGSERAHQKRSSAGRIWLFHLVSAGGAVCGHLLHGIQPDRDPRCLRLELPGEPECHLGPAMRRQERQGIARPGSGTHKWRKKERIIRNRGLV
jgi:dolichol-phosphate mannosyltransferase